MTEDAKGPQGPLLLLLDCGHLLLAQLSLHQDRVAIPMLQSWGVKPLHQHGC